ncbi:BRO family N-terminal domain containing protein [Wolbachia endosymbiont of Armadillidium vulgare str. wVulC]|uniref:BRO family protein n=1 Tax=unclassified Wolbachia TaxID=2640676 RepID=UPI00064B46A8|nr:MULTISPECIES: BRO family protein [unclassified Wolbachia]KLT22161.1 BRO family N-terminal domain containing protein [Wolbachia endosymbiont of Armadillidium vulgare str. wVulC]
MTDTLTLKEGDIETTAFDNSSFTRVLHDGEWWYVITEVIAFLTGSKNPSDYLKKIKSRDIGLSEGWGQFVTPLEIKTKGGKQNVNCTNVEGLFRILQSIPSKRVEQFKRWLAKVGYERLQEYENPELALKRIYADYAAKGYPQEWIQKRIESIAVRNQLTKEWGNRNISDHNNKYIEGREYAILTDVISEGTFGVKTKHHKEIKGLKKQPLRDHMTPIELIFNMLGEQATIDEIKDKDAQGYNKNLEAAKEGGKNAGTAREAFERARGVKVVSSDNFLKRIKD